MTDDKFRTWVFSTGGDDSNASDNDRDDGAVFCDIPLPNWKGGSWLSTEERRGSALVVLAFNSPGRRGTNFFIGGSTWGSCSNSEIDGESNMDEASAEGVGSGVGECKYVLAGSLCGRGDISMPSPGDDERIGGVVSAGGPLEPGNRLLLVGKRDLLGVFK